MFHSHPFDRATQRQQGQRPAQFVQAGPDEGKTWLIDDTCMNVFSCIEYEHELDNETFVWSEMRTRLR